MMFYYYPYSYPNNYYVAQLTRSYIRVLHASPDAPAVDIYANDNLIARNLTYRNFTQYLAVSPGKYNIKVYPTGRRDNPVLNTNADILAQSIFTVAAINRLANLSLLPIKEPIMPIPPGKVYVRFAHLSPDAPNVDIALPDGTKLFKDVAYKEVTDYIAVKPGTYTLYVKPAGTDKAVLYVPNITLRPNRFYTVYAVGLTGGNPPLQLLIPLDGNSYLKFWIKNYLLKN